MTVPELLKPIRDTSKTKQILEELSPTEYQLIKRYRNLSEAEQNMILKMLDIEVEKKKEDVG